MKDRSQVLTLQEHEAVEVGGPDGLTAGEAESLMKLGLQRPGFCMRGYRNVRVAQYAGLVNLGGRVLEILPKVGDGPIGESRGTFLRLLRLASEVPLFADGGVDHDLRRDSLLEIFVSAYLDAILSLVRTGILRRYVAEDEDLRVVRGRLLIGRQVSVNAMRIDRIACRFDDLAIDNPWNQVLKAALYACKPWLTSVSIGHRWIEAAAAFDQVSLRHDALVILGGLTSNRQVRHYQPALRWARMILRLLSPNVRAGEHEAPELLFDMNRLFEGALAAVLKRRSWVTGVRITTQESSKFLARLVLPDDAPSFGLRPDLVLCANDSIVAVGDAKWKRLDCARNGLLMPSEANMYQMHAYASVYPCEEFVLLYPWHAGIESSRSTTFQLPSISERHPQVHVACVDVGQDELPVRLGPATSRIVSLLS